jgi:hypothetical protein
MANPDYVPETKVVLASYIHSNFITRMGFDNTSDIYAAEFDRWLNKLKADIWAEGFDAGERDVWEHQHGEADENWDKDCIPNPYKEKQ